ncbi:MAG TPA: glycosyltransferase family 4 protein [Azospirillaceae bacterium]|nr:glycosyltransferase family 4 protein [Azospirillaceae bacterium]
MAVQDIAGGARDRTGAPAPGRAGKPTRVLMVVENLPVPFDRRVWQEARTLREAGFEVSVICPKGKGQTASREQVEGIEIYRHPLPLEAKGLLGFLLEYGAALFFQTWLAWRIFLGRGFDVIHAANPPDLIFLVAAQFRPFGVKFIFDHHDLMPELWFQKFKRRGAGHTAMLWMERATFALAHAVVSTNQSYRQIAIERGRKRPDQVFIVRSGPDLTRFKPVAPDPAIRAKARHIVGYVGIMGSQDGVDELIHAIGHFVKDLGRTDAHFLLVGDGPERPELEALTRRLGLEGFVTFTGYLRGEELARALSSIDVGVCPDPDNPYTSKCTMNKVMEYMALGKPLVQFDLVEGRRSALHAAVYARNGDLLDFARCIASLLDDEEMRAEKGAYGLERVRRELQWANEVPQLLAAYASLGHAPPRPVREAVPA